MPSAKAVAPTAAAEMVVGFGMIKLLTNQLTMGNTNTCGIYYPSQKGNILQYGSVAKIGTYFSLNYVYAMGTIGVNRSCKSEMASISLFISTL